MLQLQVCCAEERERVLWTLPVDFSNAKIMDVKHQVFTKLKMKVPMHRIALRLEPDGDDLTDEMPLSLVGHCVKKIFVTDLGPQIHYKFAKFLENLGPLIVYGVMFFMGDYIYEQEYTITKTFYLPFILWSLHYARRTLETLFVHRFSQEFLSTVTFFRNSAYYCGFAGFIAYHVNHPFYTPPCDMNRIIGTIIFIISEVGNFSVHLLLRDLRPDSKITKHYTPYPNKNPFTHLFKYVSFPHYTYEFGAWLGFSFATNCFYCNTFLFVGFIQMTIWATAKHRRYQKLYEKYPKDRKIIIPCLI